MPSATTPITRSFREGSITSPPTTRWRQADVESGRPFVEVCPRATGEHAAELTLALDILRDRARYDALLRPVENLDRRIARHGTTADQR